MIEVFKIIPGGVLPHSEISVKVERKNHYSGFTLRKLTESHDFVLQFLSTVSSI